MIWWTPLPVEKKPMPQVTMFAVQSSTILGIGYDSDAQELHIIFVGNHEYVYRDVPPDLWQQFRGAESVGRFFAQHIKKQYRGERQ